MGSMRIGEVAHATGVQVDTVRYYEKRGLLPRAARTDAGYRMFTEEAVDRIAFIRRAQELGFTLAEIEEILRLHRDAEARCNDVREIALEKIEDIDTRIADLERMKRGLTILVNCCDSNAPLASCPVVECVAGAAAGSDAR